MMNLEIKLIELSVGMVYSEDYILNFKKELENKEGVQLRIKDSAIYHMIYCDNDQIDKCGFHYRFVKKWDIESKDCGFQLDRVVLRHSQQCIINDEEYCFSRNKNLLLKMKNQLEKLIIQRYEIYGPETPKKILQTSKEIFSNDLIFKGLQNMNLKRKIKKKFDNLVAQIRKANNLSPTFNKRIHNFKRKTKFKFTNSKDQIEKDLCEDIGSQFIVRNFKKQNYQNLNETVKAESFETYLFETPTVTTKKKLSLKIKKPVRKNEQQL